MKDILFITFDIKRDTYPALSYSIASLMAVLKEENLGIGHLSIDIQHALEEKDEKQALSDYVHGQLKENLEYIKKFKFIAIGLTAWSSRYCINLLDHLNDYHGLVIMGGYEVTSSDPEELVEKYPRVDYFIKAYAEKALKEIIVKGLRPESKVFDIPLGIEDLRSPYLTKVIPLTSRKIHWETKRGCSFHCGFCEWGNTIVKSLPIDEDRLFKEIELIEKSPVDEINILDGTFNSGRYYLKIFDRLLKVNELNITLQARFENLITKEGYKFLELCHANRNRIHLEFGLQTIHKDEMEVIGRANKLDKIVEALSLLTKYDLSFETSIIYAIPGQTVSSFIETIEFLIENGCRNIKAYPLQIPKNSKMEGRRGEYAVTDQYDKFMVRSVSSSFSFSYEQRIDMDNIVERLNTGQLTTGEFFMPGMFDKLWDSTVNENQKFQIEIKRFVFEENNIKLINRIVEDYITPTIIDLSKEDTIQGQVALGGFARHRADPKEFVKFVNDILIGIFYYKLEEPMPGGAEMNFGFGNTVKLRRNPDLKPKEYHCRVRYSKSGNIYVFREIRYIESPT